MNNNHTAKKPEHRFLWVDDHSRDKNDNRSWLYLDHFTKAFRSVFPGAGIITAVNEGEAKIKLSLEKFSGIILDLNLAGTKKDNYLNFLKTLCDDHPDIPIIVLSNMSFPDIKEGALKSGAKAFFDRSRAGKDKNTGERVSAYKLAALEMEKHLNDSYPVPIVRLIISEKSGKVLILKRAESRHGLGAWCLPGGKVGYGDTVEEAAARELNEETSLVSNSMRFLFYQDSLSSEHGGMHCINLYLECTVKGTLSLNRESSEFAWIGPEELSNYEIVFRNDEALMRYWDEKKADQDISPNQRR